MGIMTNGVQQWVFQRICNAVFVSFGIVVLMTIVSNGLTYTALNDLFDSTVFRSYALLAVVLAGTNSILAGWQITGDYATKFHIPPCLMMAFIIVVSLAYLGSGLLLVVYR